MASSLSCVSSSFLSPFGFDDRLPTRKTRRFLPEVRRCWAGSEIRASSRQRTHEIRDSRAFARSTSVTEHECAALALPRVQNGEFCREEREESLVSEEAHTTPRIESDVRAACPCHACGRRGLMASLGGLIASSNIRAACASNYENSDYNMIREKFHPARPTWYEELYAQALARTMVSYEAEVAGYKRQLFHNLDEKVEQILELGIGTGPNLKYYATLPNLQQVVGVDPNLQMSKFCTAAAVDEGLSDPQFKFLNAVGEGIPVRDGSMDAVVCTLVLCSVTDVSSTLEEVKRILKPGGAFLFMEHVAAPDGTGLRYWQGLLDPLQQWVADGCHLTRDTLRYINEAQFGSVQSQKFTVPTVTLFSPHIFGVAYK